MIFYRPLFLLLLLLIPVFWVWFRRTPGASRTCWILKCAVFAALVIAIADPWAAMTVQRLAVTVLMDTSASMPRQSLERGQTILRELVSKNSNAELRLITFAELPRLRPVPAKVSQVTIPQGLDPDGSMSTDLEGGLQLALSTFPNEVRAESC